MGLFSKSYKTGERHQVAIAEQGQNYLQLNIFCFIKVLYGNLITYNIKCCGISVTRSPENFVQGVTGNY